MHFSKAFTVAGALIAGVTTVIAGKSVNVRLHPWNNLDCAGDEYGDHHMIDAGQCQSYDEDFSAFTYERVAVNAWLHYHDDFEEPSCQVVIYSRVACLGQGYSLGGPVNALFDQCLEVPLLGGTGRSVGVVCEQGSNDAGFIEGERFSYDTYE